MKKVLAFSGSNSSDSINQALVKYTAGLISAADVAVVDIRNFPLPMYSKDEEKQNGFPENLLKFEKLIHGADAFVISSPEHNGSTPAVFKNLLDWLSRTEGKTFGGKPMLLMSASPGANGGATNLNLLSAMLPYQGATIVATFSLGSFQQKMKDGVLEPESKELLMEAVGVFETALLSD